MGSEDADLDELGHIYLDNEKLNWETKQTGAVGRMMIDKPFLKLMETIKGRLLPEKHGPELIALLESSYTEGSSLELASFRLINHLFREYGLLVLLPDNAELKTTALEIFKDELLHQRSSEIVGETAKKLSENFKVQAMPREINLILPGRW